MIEPMMFFGVGFLVAALIGVVFIPLVHARAVRLTMRRIEAATPLSMAEIQADKDQLRAEFAMSTRRLEMSVEQTKAKMTSQLAELGKKSQAIAKLKAELGEKGAAIYGMEARERALKDELRVAKEEFTQRLNALRETERKLDDKEAELATLSADLDERAVASDSQRIEMVALHTQIEALKNRIGDSEHTVQMLRNENALLEGQLGKVNEERAKLQRDLTTMNRDPGSSWVAERAENALLRERINDIAAEIARLTATLEGPNSPIDRMLAEHAVQSIRAANGSPATVGEAGPSLIPAARNGGGNLADRIRALQTRAARLHTSN